ncbi:MAG TPA: hypothetical protein VFL82_10505 [Thermomicrobiales bacterium]|jgi:hypothetical protein|nr:hypothetical protein [Thermomicrobiales bacterium]
MSNPSAPTYTVIDAEVIPVGGIYSSPALDCSGAKQVALYLSADKDHSLSVLISDDGANWYYLQPGGYVASAIVAASQVGAMRGYLFPIAPAKYLSISAGNQDAADPCTVTAKVTLDRS